MEQHVAFLGLGLLGEASCIATALLSASWELSPWRFRFRLCGGGGEERS
jgi:hypothetical protein